MTQRSSRTLRIDLNADIGEASTREQRETEAALIQIVTSVNIACGGHCGDEGSMRFSLALAGAHGRAVGAHPSYPDREGFGRRAMAMTADDLRESLTEQLGVLARLAEEEGVRLSHVKPHGALYHRASEDVEVARAIMLAAHDLDPRLLLVGAAGSRSLAWWADWGARVVGEGFVDRAYEPGGALRARGLPGAVITSPEAAARQAVSIATRGVAIGVDGSMVPVAAATLCVHADTPGAAEIASCVSRALAESGVTLGAAG